MAATFVAGAIVVSCIQGCGAADDTAAEAIQVPSESADQLQRAKLAAEIASIRAADEDRLSLGSRLLRWAPFLTALVGLGGLAAAVMKQGSEVRLHRAKELAERRAERTRRYDETLNSVVEKLGSDDTRVRLNAAASLAPLLRLSGLEHRDDVSDTPWADAVPAEDLLPVFIANLRIEDDENIVDILVRNLGLTLRKLHASGSMPDHLDLTRVYVRRLRIPAVRMSSVDVAFSAIVDSDLAEVTAKRLRGFGAVLTGSRFTGANLQEARLNNAVCDRTRFHECRLVSATFKGADLRDTQFHRAQLQACHFEDAMCIGTNFRQANVADAWFCDGAGQRAAVLDAAALASLAKAKNWRSAHLPEEYTADLEQLSAADAPQPEPVA